MPVKEAKIETGVEWPPPRPFLKWAGGKTQLLPQLAPLLPGDLAGRRYIEPFLGSGAVFFDLAHTNIFSSCVLRDGNPELINAYVRVRDDLEELLVALRSHESEHNAPGISAEARKVYYYDIRAEQPEPGSVTSAARLIYLNKTCFNGLYRLNRKGEFNVPIGSYKNPTICDEERLRTASRVLREVAIDSADFRRLIDIVQSGDFLYLDPPYAPLSSTSSFTNYSGTGFSQKDQEDLRDVLVSISDRCEWMLSNSSADLIKELYDIPGLHCQRVSANRAINSKAHRRGKIDELIITNYPPS